jgi:hypothetical protein
MWKNCSQKIINGGVKGSIKKTLATRSNQDMTEYSQNLLITLDQRL